MTGEREIRVKLFKKLRDFGLAVSLHPQVFDLAIKINGHPYGIELKTPHMPSTWMGVKKLYFGKDQAIRQAEIAETWNLIPVLIICDREKFFVIENYLDIVINYQTNYKTKEIPVEIFPKIKPLDEWLKNL